MLGDTLTVTIGGSGGTAKVCNKINQDNYASEYLYRDADEEVNVKVRHSKENPQADGRYFDRHNLEIKHTVFAVADTSPEYVRIVSTTIRHFKADDPADVSDVVEASSYYLDETQALKIIGWES
jgi:hypothetical protein